MSKEVAQSADLAVARVASGQHGVITVEQLRAAGVDSPAISYRVATGRLHRLFRGVYAVGHARLSNEGRWMAAVLACGAGAVLSHRSAAELWRMLSPRNGPVEVTVARRSGRNRRPGIRLHRSTTFTQQETTRRAGIPVTSPARTLADLRACTTPDEQSRARREAEFRRYPVELADPKPIEMTRSELERRFLRLCHRHHLPSPEVDARIEGYVVDFLWRSPRLIVETDGYHAHSGRATFEHDHRRQAQLVAAGYEVLRFTWRQVIDEPDEVAAALRARLTPTLTQPEPATR
jgi:very-short-patch-repair endonuclease